MTAFSNPPPNHRLLTQAYSSLEELEADLYDYCAQARFSVAKLRSVNKVKDFGYTRVDYGCAKGKIRASKATSRITSTSKVGCNWEASAKALLVDGARPWRFSIKPGFEQHLNHKPEDWKASNKFMEEHVEFIKQYLDRRAVKNRELFYLLTIDAVAKTVDVKPVRCVLRLFTLGCVVAMRVVSWQLLVWWGHSARSRCP